MLNYLVLQVYCSPSLKELLHNLVITLLARTDERKGSILDVWLCVQINLSALVPVHSEWCIQIYEVYIHVLVITQVQYNMFMSDCDYMR